MKRRPWIVVALSIAVLTVCTSSCDRNDLRFDVSIDSHLPKGPVTGRMLVIVATDDGSEPRFQVDVEGDATVWGTNVAGLHAGDDSLLGSGTEVYGYPLSTPDRLPAGRYYVQAFLNVYTTFSRSDGSVVQLHMPCGDGQDFWRSPGNLFSRPQWLKLGPGAGTVKLALSQVVQPSDPVPEGGTCQQGNASDSEHVKHVKIESHLLSGFWGQPMYIGADVLLPQGYGDPSNADRRYPVVYLLGHFPYENPYGFGDRLRNPFSRWWVSRAAPRLIVVQLRDENPYFDDSYAVNSANLGPYGDAITSELIPRIDRRFRTIDRPSARALTGASTGGWEALAQQVFYPDMYGGVWSLCPDPVDFRALQVVNIYRDANAYYTQDQGEKVPRPSAREPSGKVQYTMAQENHYELALGTDGRSGLGQWDIWQAAYGPEGANGYPAPIWNKRTGLIDHGVAQAWQPKDIRSYLQERWQTLGPKLRSRLHIYIGTADTYFLNGAVRLLQRFLDRATHPTALADIRYGQGAPHCWSPFSDEELLTRIGHALDRHN